MAAKTLCNAWAERLRDRAGKIAPHPEHAKLASFQDDPVGFSREILGVKPCSYQRDILTAAVHHRRIAVVSGHKTGKSATETMLALWFYCSFPEARVRLTGPKDKQVNEILWREVRRFVMRAERRGYAIPGADRIALLAQTGMTNPFDLSEIKGAVARDKEAAAGISGGYTMLIGDEASGIPDDLFEAYEGNRAGGNAWMILASNPTKADGEFFEAFHSKSQDAVGPRGYKTFIIDSRQSPNVTGEWREISDAPIPGMADPAWIEERLEEWGADSPQVKVRIGNNGKLPFVVAEEAKIFSSLLLIEATQRWEETKPSGRLYIGVDPAGDGDRGDESGFCARRGLKVLGLHAQSGMSPNAHIVQVQALIGKHHPKGYHELPIVVCESEGLAGWKVYVALKEHADRTGEFEVYRARTSSAAFRQPLLFDRMRDEIWAVARDWMRRGGAIPENVKLEKDLHAPEFFSDLRGRMKVTAKRELKKNLGRSPDTGDAFVLSCWEPLSARAAVGPQRHEQHTDSFDEVDSPEPLDPYAGSDAFRV